jgi:hypothetical protein
MPKQSNGRANTNPITGRNVKPARSKSEDAKIIMSPTVFADMLSFLQSVLFIRASLY